VIAVRIDEGRRIERIAAAVDDELGLFTRLFGNRSPSSPYLVFSEDA